MSPKLIEQIDVELQQLEKLFEILGPLANKFQAARPDSVELYASAALLHSFYTGIENIFERVAIELDGVKPNDGGWHHSLLKQMARPGVNRPAVVSEELRSKLREYLDFRHVFRHAYSFELQWNKMASLVLNCEAVRHQLERELKAFTG